MFKRIVSVAALAGVMSGLLLTVIQQIEIVPLIEAASLAPTIVTVVEAVAVAPNWSTSV